MMEAGWSAWRVARQLGRSGCIVRRCLDQRIRDMSFTRIPGSGSSRQTSRREERHLIDNGAAMLSGMLYSNDYEGKRVTRCTEVLPSTPLFSAEY
ncbi:hypothetical protein TNCV_3227301 [Trichonephila clavipes]|nr:hypothetical protein TNCV_3227301 [Trichonephila clavipes]